MLTDIAPFAKAASSPVIPKLSSTPNFERGTCSIVGFDEHFHRHSYSGSIDPCFHHSEKISSHYCGIFSTNEKLLEATINCLIDGFRQHDKCYLFEDDKHRIAHILRHLDARGFSTTDLMHKGDLNILDSAQMYIHNGMFSIDTMLRVLAERHEEAKQQGYTKLRVTGEPAWVFCVENMWDAFVEYERAVNEFFNGTDAYAMCSYSQERWSSSFILKILAAHPNLVLDDDEYDNCYYVPWEQNQELDKATLDIWITHLRERKTYEAALHEASTKAIQQAEAKSKFLATMSHEMRTPLNGVIGMTDLLCTSNLKPEQMQCVDIIRSSGNHLLTVINDVLDMASIESGKLKLESSPITLRRSLKSAWDICITAANKKAVRLNFLVCKGVPDLIVGDATRLSQVLVNLIGNAIKFTNEQSTVTITVKREGDIVQTCSDKEQEEQGEGNDQGWFMLNERMRFVTPNAKGVMLSFTVCDQGIGIPPDKLDIIFESFTQADTFITRKFGGTGLGLSICKNITNIWGGDITVRSEVGKYSAFTFYLPTVQRRDGIIFEKDTELNMETLHLMRSNESLKAGGKLNDRLRYEAVKVLVAEDNPVNQIVMKKLLGTIGCNVTFADNGKIAYEKTLNEQFDIIFMDIHMPVCDGYEASEKIRLQHKEKCPLIYALTAASTLSETERESVEKWMDGYILKPVRLNVCKKYLDDFIASKTSMDQNSAKE